jgi:hypothetical protein
MKLAGFPEYIKDKNKIHYVQGGRRIVLHATLKLVSLISSHVYT